MKIAREIAEHIDDRQGLGPRMAACEIESIIAAKLEPVKEALDILLSVEEYDTINYAFDSDSIKECRDALAMFDD